MFTVHCRQWHAACLLNTAGLADVVVSKSHFDLILGVHKIFHSAISLLATERSMSINLM